MPVLRTLLSLALALPILAGGPALAGPVRPDFSKPEDGEILSGGAATSINPVNRNAFRNRSGNLPDDQIMRFHLGRALFRKLWVPAPSSTQGSDGLGPLFNARSCESCHVRDGRGRTPDGSGDATSFFYRLARPPETEAERQQFAEGRVLNFPDPVYGTQFQDHAVTGLAAEGQVRVTYAEKTETLGDGTKVSLRVPTYDTTGLNYGPLGTSTTLSPRLTPPMIGLGLIQAIPENAILAAEDEADRDRDGISGKAQRVLDPETGTFVLGRFGWKAQNATVRAQTASALAGDIGISSPDANQPFGDCTSQQPECLARPTGEQARLGKTEAPGEILDLLTFYAENLAVPARRKASFPAVLAGKKVFYELGCAACHQPQFRTGPYPANPALAGQKIWPYSDFLLHDMGEDLADQQPVGRATGTEWRTPPLWGIGLTATVNGRENYLHDGRARSLTEAILWHGGEGEKARKAFRDASARDRQSLITFLESL